jgi:hypothetical protein
VSTTERLTKGEALAGLYMLEGGAPRQISTRESGLAGAPSPMEATPNLIEMALTRLTWRGTMPFLADDAVFGGRLVMSFSPFLKHQDFKNILNLKDNARLARASIR